MDFRRRFSPTIILLRRDRGGSVDHDSNQSESQLSLASKHIDASFRWYLLSLTTLARHYQNMLVSLLS
eukprot:COSAG02_NODE_4019_length_5896_cov_75.960152_4_plen_68_part_00